MYPAGYNVNTKKEILAQISGAVGYNFSMKKEILAQISQAAPVLPETPTAVLSGAMLTARYCYDAIAMQHGNPIASGDIAALVEGYRGKPIAADTVRQIVNALKSGGLPIELAWSRGYWIEG